MTPLLSIGDSIRTETRFACTIGDGYVRRITALSESVSPLAAKEYIRQELYDILNVRPHKAIDTVKISLLGPDKHDNNYNLYRLEATLKDVESS